MLRLILTRHAKSDWDDPRIADFDRPLNSRGTQQAGKLGRWLAANSTRPDLVLCSEALRTQQTWARIAENSGWTPEVQVTRKLYHAGEFALMLQLQKAPPVKVLMIVAHNPGIAGFAEDLLKTPPAHPEFMRYPTGATTIMDIDAEDWALVEPRKNRLVDFVIPRELD